MKRVLFLIAIAAVVNLSTAIGQSKKPLDHSVYDSWESLSSPKIPNNGEYLTYSINKQQGDGTLYIYNISSEATIEIPRGTSPVFSTDGATLLYRISPLYAQTHAAKVKKKKGDDLPKDTLVVMNLKSGEKKSFPNLKSVKYGEHLQSHIAFQCIDKKNSSLLVMNLQTNKIDTINIVDKYKFSDDGKYLAYTTKPEKKDTINSRALILMEVESGVKDTILSGDKKIKLELPIFDPLYPRVAFYAQVDTTKEGAKYSDIYLYDISSNKCEKLITKETQGIQKGWIIGDKHTLRFAEEGNSHSAEGGVLWFGIKPQPKEIDTTVAEFERVKLDIWRWNADYLPTVEEVRKNEFANKAYLTAYYFSKGGEVVQIETHDVPSINIPENLQGDIVLTSSDKPYRVMRQWETNPHNDIYKVNLRSGEKELIFKDARNYTLLPSPKGNFYTLFDAQKGDWFLYDVKSGSCTNITEKIGYPFWDEDTDTPGEPRPYGVPIWEENESYFLLRDRFDLWQFDPTSVKEPFTVTEGIGRETNTQFSVERLIITPQTKLNRFGAPTGPLKKGEPLYLSSFNKVTKEHGFYMKDITKKRGKMVKLVEGPYNITINALSIPSKSRKGAKPIFAYTKGDYTHSYNLFITRDMFGSEKRLTNTNPQQSDYNWGTVEMVSWMTADSIEAQGLLFKPEDFDPNKKYPVLIYFYEKHSDDLYNYRSPAPSRSIINIPYFVSNGYIVFNPDIYYTTGHPGQSAMRSIMPGVDMLCQYPWIDSENMAIQGQSWGGYQVAYMITQTDRFKAAGSGAPVSNMTSAYGGIRWGSGVTRQMQYERGQSRIGVNLWEGFDLYVENSPLFFVPNVTTPVLIMHNDKDTAVPWYQGIEFFASLRRLGKQAWMLQYKGEDHNLRERHNCKDLSEKLAEFFDHFLKGAPEPEWMKVE